MLIGRIKWFDKQKGYGFISYKYDEDIFVHQMEIKEDDIKGGEIVKFKLLNTIKGYQAINVKVLERKNISDNLLK